MPHGHAGRKRVNWWMNVQMLTWHNQTIFKFFINVSGGKFLDTYLYSFFFAVLIFLNTDIEY